MIRKELAEMKKIVLMVLGLMLFLMSCTSNGTSDGDDISETTSPEIPIINDAPTVNKTQETPNFEISIVNKGLKDEDYEYYFVDYAYLTDMLGEFPVTLVQQGDMFLGWRAESIEVGFEKYDDDSISYWSALIEFTGEAEIRARLEYFKYDPETENGGDIFVTVHEESKHLIPNLPHRINRNHFLIYMDESDERFNDIFSETDGYIIEDCRIVISDYGIVFAFTNVHDDASFVEIKR